MNSHFTLFSHNTVNAEATISVELADFYTRMQAAINTLSIDKISELINEADQHNYILADMFIDKFSLVHYTIMKCNDKNQALACNIIDLLLNKGINIDQSSIDNLEFTPLCTAARRGLNDVVEYLLERGAAAAKVDGTGRTPLDYVKLAMQAKKDDTKIFDRLDKIYAALLRSMEPFPYIPIVDKPKK